MSTSASRRATRRLALLAGLLTGCMSYRPVTAPLGSSLPADPHTEVRVTRRNGEQLRLVATAFVDDSLVGRNFANGNDREAIASADIAALEIGEGDGEASVALVLALIVGSLYLLLCAISHGDLNR